MEKTFYDAIGGEPVLRKLIKRFYEVMDTMPEAAGIRAMHGADLSETEDKLFAFMSGWLGGPQLFMEKYGHPRMRARHMPFKIGKSERDQWMLCMVQAVEDIGMEEPVRSQYLHALLEFADFMRNQGDK